MPTVTVQVGANADDGFEEGGAWFLSAGSDDPCGASGGNTYNYACRFASGFNVPQGATISAASLLINTVAGVGTGTATFYGNRVGNSAALGSSNRPSQLAQTTASTPVTLPGSTPQTLDVTAIIQEIVNQGAYASGNAVTLFALGTSSGNNYGQIVDYAGGAANAAQLSVTYTGGAGPATEGIVGGRVGSMV